MPLGTRQIQRADNRAKNFISGYDASTSELQLPEPNFDLFAELLAKKSYDMQNKTQSPQSFNAQGLTKFMPEQYAGPVGGALAGLQAGIQNAENDPNMSNQKDGFGAKYKDRRAEVGGAVLGGVMGYFGGPAGASLAGPAVTLVHPIAEKTTRTMIKFGDSWGGSGGALMMDPIGTVASGKYNAGQLLKGALLGPFSKLIG